MVFRFIIRNLTQLFRLNLIALLLYACVLLQSIHTLFIIGTISDSREYIRIHAHALLYVLHRDFLLIISIGKYYRK